jgi:hypothetical protein
MSYGTPHGIGAIGRHTGTRGNPSTGIIITDTIIAGTIIIMAIIATGTITVITIGTTSISPPDGPIPRMFTQG